MNALAVLRTALSFSVTLLCVGNAHALDPVAPATPVTKPDVIEISPFPTGGDFRLREKAGWLQLASLKGKVTVLFFGYTSCPDVCPSTLGTLSAVAQQLTSLERAQLRVVFITLDPKRDTAEVLHDYVHQFPLVAHGLTGSPETIAEIAQRYGAQYRQVALPDSSLGYAIDHSAAVYLIDREGRLRLLLRHNARIDRYVNEIRRLLHAP